MLVLLNTSLLEITYITLTAGACYGMVLTVMQDFSNK